jgi:lysophospholipase L1-like esterase
MHLSPEGHQVLADWLADNLRPIWSLGASAE